MVMRMRDLPRTAPVPSSREIDAHFFYGPVPLRLEEETGLSDPGDFTPFDIEYSTSAGEHDQRALFLQAFLISSGAYQEQIVGLRPLIAADTKLARGDHHTPAIPLHPMTRRTSCLDGSGPWSAWIAEIERLGSDPGSRVPCRGNLDHDPDYRPHRLLLGPPARWGRIERHRDPAGLDRVDELIVGLGAEADRAASHRAGVSGP